MPYVFVYGSLRKGLQNHGKLMNANYVGTFKTSDTYYMIGLKSKAYPYVTCSKLHESLQASHITGELYKVDDDLLKELDALEGHPHNYKRTEHIINDYKAFIYLLENEEMKSDIMTSFERRFVSVISGDWVDFLMQFK